MKWKFFFTAICILFLSAPVAFATCGLFDFSFHFESKHKKQVEEKPPTLTLSPEMNRPRVTIQKEMHVREIPSNKE